MLFVAFQEVVAGIADNRPRRAPNHYHKPAETSEPTRDHMIRLTEDEVEMVAVEFHARLVAENPKASFHASTRQVEMLIGADATPLLACTANCTQLTSTAK
jgi:hypothetical protein